MIEKRFKLANPNSSFLSMNCGIKNGDRLLNFKEVVDLLNSLNNENEQLRYQLQSILKLTRKIEDYAHDIKMIGDVE